MNEFCAHLDRLCEHPAGTAKPEMTLNDLPGWDSMSAVGFMSMVDREYGVAVASAKLVEAKTVADLAALAGVS